MGETVTQLPWRARPHRDELDPRRAGQIGRYHTWPRHRDQSIAEHSWQVVRIILAIWPAAPLPLIRHALFHDVGETVTGDLPFPSKRDNPDLKAATSRMEWDAHLEMATRWALPPPFNLATDELAVAKLAHSIEMWEWALYEQGLGNTYARLVEDRCWVLIQEASTQVSLEVRLAASLYVERRLKQEGRKDEK